MRQNPPLCFEHEISFLESEILKITQAINDQKSEISKTKKHMEKFNQLSCASISDFTLVPPEIGSGSHGAVFKVQHKTTNELFAINVVEPVPLLVNAPWPAIFLAESKVPEVYINELPCCR